jgi:pyridoxal phosphate-dependent aminotransferase EpsN
MSEQRIFLSPPHLGANTSALVSEAIASNYVAYPGPHLKAFEEAFIAYTGVQHAAAMSSGTAALHVAMVALGIGPGDTVLTSDLTFIGSVNPITYLGATPIFIDSEPGTWNMDPALLREAVEDCVKAGKKPKAVVDVHLYGLPSRIDEIKAICDDYDILYLEDCAESAGTLYKGKHTGTFGKVGCFSFNGNKIITTGGGGMVVSEDKALIDKMVFLSTQARDPAPYYLHSERGYNYRMSNILAAVGVAQMQVLEDRVKARRANYDYYAKRLEGKGVTMMPRCEEIGRATFWLSCMVLDKSYAPGKPEAIRLALEKHNIETRRIWKPMHTQPIFKDCRMYGGSFDELLFERGLCLPSGSALTEADLDRVTTALEAELG